jgi:hypothetical protein
MSFNLANAWKRGGLLLALLATFCVMQPSAATQG